ncbi:MAG: hypothetical protein VX438_13050, partial [Planctomycetota bacterium]|nr:hypothetical protein [Planctomycetota bacterium]
MPQEDHRFKESKRVNILKPLLKPRPLQTGVIALAWSLALLDWLWIQRLPAPVSIGIFTLVLLGVSGVFYKQYRRELESPLQFWIVFSFCLPVWWHAGVYFSEKLGLELLRAYFARGGLAVFFITGLAWVVWIVEKQAQRIEAARRTKFNPDEFFQNKRHHQQDHGDRIWNPLDPSAWYYGRKSPKLNQSLNSFVSYTVLFCLVCMILSQFQG